MRTGLEKMLAGELYDPFDPELARAQRTRDAERARPRGRGSGRGVGQLDEDRPDAEARQDE
ncbi:MAG: hypothetical protein JWO38_3607 [Gemmataceae bacterium]|nr:hypothetical protein [Gemmataceae bacterium]